METVSDKTAYFSTISGNEVQMLIRGTNFGLPEYFTGSVLSFNFSSRVPNRVGTTMLLSPDPNLRSTAGKLTTRILPDGVVKFGAKHQSVVVIPELACNQNCNASNFMLTAITTSGSKAFQTSIQYRVQYLPPRISYVHVSGTNEERKLTIIGLNFGRLGFVRITSALHASNYNWSAHTPYDIDLITNCGPGKSCVNCCPDMSNNAHQHIPLKEGDEAMFGSYISSYSHTKIEVVYKSNAKVVQGFLSVERAHQQSRWINFRRPSPKITKIGAKYKSGWKEDRLVFDTIGWGGGNPPGFKNGDSAKLLGLLCENCGKCHGNECDLKEIRTKISICVGVNDPSEEDMFNPSYPKRKCLTPEELLNSNNLGGDPEVANFLQNKTEYESIANCVIISIERHESSDALKKDVLNITCRPPAGEGEVMIGYLESDSMRSLPFEVNYRKPEINNVEVCSDLLPSWTIETAKIELVHMPERYRVRAQIYGTQYISGVPQNHAVILTNLNAEVKSALFRSLSVKTVTLGNGDGQNSGSHRFEVLMEMEALNSFFASDFIGAKLQFGATDAIDVKTVSENGGFTLEGQLPEAAVGMKLLVSRVAHANIAGYVSSIKVNGFNAVANVYFMNGIVSLHESGIVPGSRIILRNADNFNGVWIITDVSLETAQISFSVATDLKNFTGSATFGTLNCSKCTALTTVDVTTSQYSPTVSFNMIPFPNYGFASVGGMSAYAYGESCQNLEAELNNCEFDDKQCRIKQQHKAPTSGTRVRVYGSNFGISRPMVYIKNGSRPVEMIRNLSCVGQKYERCLQFDVLRVKVMDSNEDSYTEINMTTAKVGSLYSHSWFDILIPEGEGSALLDTAFRWDWGVESSCNDAEYNCTIMYNRPILSHITSELADTRGNYVLTVSGENFGRSEEYIANQARLLAQRFAKDEIYGILSNLQNLMPPVTNLDIMGCFPRLNAKWGKYCEEFESEASCRGTPLQLARCRWGRPYSRLLRELQESTLEDGSWVEQLLSQHQQMALNSGLSKPSYTSFTADDIQVKVGNKICPVFFHSQEELKCIVPEGQGRNHEVSVTISTQSNTDRSVLFHYSLPFIHSVEVLDHRYNLDRLPTSGHDMNGNPIKIRINGSNFGDKYAKRSLSIFRTPGDDTLEPHVWQGFEIDTFHHASHTCLVFALKSGEGTDLRMLLHVDGQTPSNDFSPHMSAFDGTMSPPLVMGTDTWPSRLSHSNNKTAIMNKAFVRGSIGTDSSAQAQPPLSMFARMDKNGDKALSRQEFKWGCAYIAEDADPSHLTNSIDGEDTDGDGIVDAWENANGLDPNSRQDGSADLDGDGLTNFQNYIGGGCWDEQSQWKSDLNFRVFPIKEEQLMSAFADDTRLVDQENIRVSYGLPRIDTLAPGGIMNEQKSDGYLWPTSGCSKFMVGDFNEQGEARCDAPAYFTLTGENFGLTEPMVVVKDEESKTLFAKVFTCQTNGCASQRTHNMIVAEVPKGVGLASVEVWTRDVNTEKYYGPPGAYVLNFEGHENRRLNGIRHDDRVSMFSRKSNFLRFQYSPPDIFDTRFGPDINSASQSGVIAAIGSKIMGAELGIPHRFYILGENFGENASLVKELRAISTVDTTGGVVFPATRRVTENGRVLGKDNSDYKCKKRPEPEPDELVWRKCLEEDAWESSDCYTVYGHQSRSDSVWAVVRSEDPYCPELFQDAQGLRHTYKCYATDKAGENGVCKMEDHQAINITFVSRDTNEPVECLDPQWHRHTKHPWPHSGRPFLSCIAPPTTVGRKDLQVFVARFSRKMEIPLDSRCFEGYYGQIGEYCVECWNYLTRHPNIPDATKKTFAAKCYATYNKSIGTSEPVSERGFAVLPPPICQNGECKLDIYRNDSEYREDPYFSNNYEAVPTECLTNPPDHTRISPHLPDFEGVIPLQHSCQKATQPGINCHPARVNGTLELESGVLVDLTAARSTCPYIMPCEPPESCLTDGQCNHKDGYVSYYKPYFEGFDEDGEKVMQCNMMHYRLPQEIRGSALEKEMWGINLDMGVGEDNLTMPCKYADCNDGNAVDINDQLQCDKGNRMIALNQKNSDPFWSQSQMDELREFSRDMFKDWQDNASYYWDIGGNASLGLKSFFSSYKVTNEHLNGEGLFDYACPYYNEAGLEDESQYPIWWACLVHQKMACKRNDAVKEECLQPRDDPRFWRTGCMCYAPRCSQCNPGTHFRLDGECEPCPSQPWLIPLMMLAGAIFGSMAMRIMTRLSINMTIINIGIDYAQIISLFSRSKAQWPDDLKIVIELFAIFQFDIDLAAPECLPTTGPLCEVPLIGYFCKLKGWINFERKWFMKVSLPFIGGLFVAIAMTYIAIKRSIKRCIQSKHLTRAEILAMKQKAPPLCAQVVSMINTLIYFLYLGICRAALSIFNCIDTKPITGRKYLAAEPMQECYVPGGVQQRLHPWAVGFLIFYCIGFPAYIFILFTINKKKIIEDQTMRAYGRGEDPMTNKNFGMRKMFGKMYYAYRPTKYWWALIVIWKKFLVVLFGVMFRNFPTFQMAITLFVVFLAFSAHVDNDPFMGMIEKAEIIRSDAEETILREIKKLERSQLLVRINGKAYYQLMHSMRVQIDEQELIMAKHHNSPYNYNNIEAVFLMTSCVVVLAGIMFDSDWILERIVVPEYEIRGKVISYLVIFLVVFSIVYYVIVFIHECRSATKRQQTGRQLMWARVKSNTSKIRSLGVKKILAGHKDYKTGKVIKQGNSKNGGSVPGGNSLNLSKVVPLKAEKSKLSKLLQFKPGPKSERLQIKMKTSIKESLDTYKVELVKGAGPHGITLGTRTERYKIKVGPGKSGIAWENDVKGGIKVKSVDYKLLNSRKVSRGHHLVTLQGKDMTKELLENVSKELMNETKLLSLEISTEPKRHIVTAITPGSAAEKLLQIKVGHYLRFVGNKDVSNLTNREAMAAIGSMQRPHTLTLQRGHHHHHHHHHQIQNRKGHTIKKQTAKKIAVANEIESSSASDISSSSDSNGEIHSSSSSGEDSDKFKRTTGQPEVGTKTNVQEIKFSASNIDPKSETSENSSSSGRSSENSSDDSSASSGSSSSSDSD